MLVADNQMEWFLQRLWDTIDWGVVGSTLWDVGSRTANIAGSSLALLSTLPRECKLATVHASAICAGEDPIYYSTPGFGPIQVAPDGSYWAQEWESP